MLYHASWVRMLAFCWLDPKFRFHSAILYIPPSCAASAQLNLIIPIALRTSSAFSAPYNCILYLSKPNVLYKHIWLLDISQVLYILSACDTDELIYTCAYRLQASLPLAVAVSTTE